MNPDQTKDAWRRKREAANGDGVLSEADVQAARHLVDAWSETCDLGDTGTLLELRGMVAALAADCRTAGYLEGLQVGRRQVGGRLRDLLEDEGL